ncbi:hypothetical protein ANN_22879 [Periplaneta americana]|uniref:Uncharacterized protein n=1 Tax=Periplaneta americana TaxID=6978 RepID=A0ABQ8SJN5_PERAM|nr:hypothetical protein ANN_22879 [Periplaneta americana]
MAGLCEGGNEPPGSLKAINTMKGFLSTMVLVCLAVRLVMAGPQCDLGKQIVDKVDDRFINGPWMFKYSRPKNFSQEVGRCWKDNYVLGSNGIAQKIINYTSQKTGETVTVTASAQLVGDHTMNITLLQFPPELGWISGIFDILAWDEDKGYSIIGACRTMLKNELTGFSRTTQLEVSGVARKALALQEGSTRRLRSWLPPPVSRNKISLAGALGPIV